MHLILETLANLIGWEIFFLTTCGRFERRFGNIIENIERHVELIDKEGNVIAIEETQASLRQLLARQKESLTQIEADEKQESTRQYADVLSRLQIDERDQVAIFDALADSLKYEGTCSWALRQDNIASWLDAKGHVYLAWLQGSAGTGKSMLAAHLIKFLQSSGRYILYHFCSNQYIESKKYDQVLRSMVRQLLQISDEATAHAHATLLRERKTPSISEIERLVADLLVIVSETSTDTNPIWIIVDGVDECDAEKLPRLMGVLSGRTRTRRRTSTASKPITCRVLLTSRFTPQFERGFGGIRVISLSADDIRVNLRAAIRAYVECRLRSPRSRNRLYQLNIGRKELQDIASEVTDKADGKYFSRRQTRLTNVGMFLYARLILDYLGSQLLKDKEELKQKVSLLPKTLQEL